MLEVLMIDNFDSFTYNVVDLLQRTCKVRVVRNDYDGDPIDDFSPDILALSPGPGGPADSGICMELVGKYENDIPILGICLGMQIIAAAAGGAIIRAKQVMHGKSSPVFHTGGSLWNDIPSPFSAMRYHSLCVDLEDLPKSYTITARTEDDTPMAIESANGEIVGLQFHPDSFATLEGEKIIANYIARIR